MALTDTLDDLISERRIEPQLAMKILANFDRSITEVLADKVKARLTFKVYEPSQAVRGITVARLTG
jgi:transcription initiation factor TFIIA small subunit